MRFPVTAAVSCFLFVGASIAYAQQYTFQYYGVDQGLTDLAVRKIFQDARGYLWLSTETGVFRYDGERFQSVMPTDGLPSSNAAMFGEAPDGSLLVGGKFGLYRNTGTGIRFERVPLPGVSKVMWGAGIQADHRGTTWIATDAGLFRMTATAGQHELQMKLVANPSNSGSPAANGVFAEAETVWWGCGDQICTMSDDKTRTFGPEAGLRPGVWHGILRAGNGDLWVQSVAGDVALLRNSQKGKARFEKPVVPQLAGFGPRGLITVDRLGNVIIPVNDGLAIGNNGHWQTIGRPAGIRGPVYSVFQDREGSVWLGLAGHGIAKWLGYQQWQYFNTDSGLGSDLAYEVAPAENGAFWAGTDAGLYLGSRTTSGWRWEHQKKLENLPIHSVRPDGHGKLWLGTEGRGAARLDTKTGNVEWFGKAQGLAAESPYTLMLDHRNRIWAASLTGLYVADLTALRFRPVEGLPGHTFCLAVTEAANGDIWAGTKDGLFQFSGGRWHQFTTRNGLSHNEVLSLAADPNGDVWVGYQFGPEIDRIRAEANLTVSHESAGSAASSATRNDVRPAERGGTTYFLGFDANGRLWAGTNRGVDVRNGSDWTHYDHHDGLVWDDCDLNGFRANPDGTVWLGTSGGLALFTPKETTALTAPPKAVLTQLTLGKKSMDVGTKVSVDHSDGSLTARFSALTFTRENAVVFRYRLSPLFKDWRETGERQLDFPGLPPGDYRLEVQARDGWGRWSQEAATFSFDILPPFWLTWWFIGLIALIPLGTAALVLRLRDNAMRRKEQILTRLVNDRTAELQEANRSLLQLSTTDSLTGISNRRVFDETLSKEWNHARRSGDPLSLIIADIDFFKKLNDAYGHQTGDECLRLVARALTEVGRRDTDCISRYGGEEFALILPGADGEEAARLAECARQHIEQLALPNPDSSLARHVTITLGVATATTENCPSADALLRAADGALYAAKAGGRNRVSIGDPAWFSLDSNLSQDLQRIIGANIADLRPAEMEAVSRPA